MSRHFSVDAQAVHVWALHLDASDEDLAQFWSWLSAEEQARANRFKFDRHRRDFIVSHGVLRALLGRYSNLSAANITYSYGPKGKPALSNPRGTPRFNMSHSGRVAIYGFTAECELGIDVECVRLVTDMEEIAARFFSREETAELNKVAEADRTEAFFQCWTRKEAYIKAVGEGLSIPLDQFQVSLKPGEPAQLLSLAGDASAARNWTLHHFVPVTGYLGAVAYRGATRTLALQPALSARDLLAALT